VRDDGLSHCWLLCATSHSSSPTARPRAAHSPMSAPWRLACGPTSTLSSRTTSCHYRCRLPQPCHCRHHQGPQEEGATHLPQQCPDATSSMTCRMEATSSLTAAAWMRGGCSHSGPRAWEVRPRRRPLLHVTRDSAMAGLQQYF
jgi:hypothetical protein